jgi:hypothetical protein
MFFLVLACTPPQEIKLDTGKPDNLTGIQIGDLLIEPSVLDFGDISVDQTAVSEVYFTNLSEDGLSVSSLYLEGDSAFELESSLLSFDMYSDEEVVILVKFKPEEEIEYTSTMNILLSNIADITEFEILGVGGSGEENEEPSNENNSGLLTITPDNYAYPATTIGETVEGTFQLTNTSNDRIAINSLISTNPVFEYGLTSQIGAGRSIDPMETKNLIMKFSPESIGPENGVVTLTTDSESVPRIELYLQGEGACSLCSPQINTYGAQFAQFDVGMYTSLIETQDMIISNTGDQTLTISNVSAYNDNQVPGSIDVYVSISQTAPNCGLDANFSASIDKTTIQPGEEGLLTVNYEYSGDEHLTNSNFYGCVESNGYSRVEILSNDTQNPIVTLDLQGMVSAF